MRATFIIKVLSVQLVVSLCSGLLPNDLFKVMARKINPLWASNQNDGSNSRNDRYSVRLNKVFKATHSRRGADELIASGRVTINGLPTNSKGGSYVIPFKDVVRLDGKVVTGWEDMNVSDQEDDATERFEYIKYYKPLGVTCTTDLKIKRNIIDEITMHGGFQPRHRIFPVGRLDKDTTGLILLTSDGRLPNASLRVSQKQPKTYIVGLDHKISDQDLQKLRDGIVITTMAQRDNTAAKVLTARTKPCTVERLSTNRISMTIMEGRNRQIRKMLEALNYNVVTLKRVKFSGISLDDLKQPGDWKRLNKKEMKIVEGILKQYIQ